MSRMKIRLRHGTRSARNQVVLPHRGVPCFAAADCLTQRSTSDNFRCSHVAKGLTYPTEVRACRDLTRGGGYAPPHRHAEVCRRFAKPSTKISPQPTSRGEHCCSFSLLQLQRFKRACGYDALRGRVLRAVGCIFPAFRGRNPCSIVFFK